MGRIMIRPLDVDDLEILEKIDGEYCRNYSVEAIIGLSSLNFYSRSGHSFASVSDGRLNGFVLAHAVWGGYKAVLQIARLAVSEDDDAVHLALLEAVIKSAYDAAVYELRVVQPENDNEGLAALQQKEFRLSKAKLLKRTLGSGKYGE